MRTYWMKMRWFLLLVMGLMVLSLAGCFGDFGEEEENPEGMDPSQEELLEENVPTGQIFIDENNTFSIETDLEWARLEKGELNENADLEIADDQEGYYLMVMRESKSDFNMSFAEYTDFTAQMNGQAFGAEFGEKQIATVNGLNAYYYEFSGTYDYLNAFITFYTIEGAEDYYMLFAWGMDSDRDDLKETLIPILDSFQEL